MDPKVAATLKWTAFVLIAFVLFAIGSKHYKKHARKEALAAEMRLLISESSFYHSITEKDARGVLLRGIAMIDEAKSLGLEPADYFDRVFGFEKDLLSGDSDERDFDMEQRLAHDTLIRGYQHAQQLGLLAGPDERAAMARGEMPDVSPAPCFAYVIDPGIAPGLEKVVPNLVLRPAGSQDSGPNDLEIAAARELAGNLRSVGILDYEGEKKIIERLRPKE